MCLNKDPSDVSVFWTIWFPNQKGFAIQACFSCSTDTHKAL